MKNANKSCVFRDSILLNVGHFQSRVITQIQTFKKKILSGLVKFKYNENKILMKF